MSDTTELTELRNIKRVLQEQKQVMFLILEQLKKANGDVAEEF